MNIESKRLRRNPDEVIAQHSRSDTIMARILSELSEFSFALSHSFADVRRFGETQPSRAAFVPMTELKS
jgi:hypothetical protein